MEECFLWRKKLDVCLFGRTVLRKLHCLQLGDLQRRQNLVRDSTSKVRKLNYLRRRKRINMTTYFEQQDPLYGQNIEKPVFNRSRWTKQQTWLTNCSQWHPRIQQKIGARFVTRTRTRCALQFQSLNLLALFFWSLFELMRNNFYFLLCKQQKTPLNALKTNQQMKDPWQVKLKTKRN